MDSTLADASPASPPSTGHAPANQAHVCRKVATRLIPPLFAAYLFCQLDRLNISFAQLQMKSMPGFGDSVYGLGAGLFFISYMLFQVPGSLLLQRIGVRKALLLMMVGWGCVSIATVLVRTPAQFYAARLLLGACEAGFLPGIVYYISTWLPAVHRGRAIGIMMSAALVAAMLGGPLAGFLMGAMHGVGHLAGWQWLLIVEGLPSALLGAIVFWRMDDRPGDATWLSKAEKTTLEHAIAADHQMRAHDHRNLAEVVRDPGIYLLGLIFFLTTLSAHGMGFWAPQIIQSFGASNVLHIGLYSAIPSAAAFIGVIVLSRHSDRQLERRLHYALPIFAGAAALAVVASLPRLPLAGALFGLSIAYAGLLSVIPIFWAIATSYLGKEASAGGIAFINMLGSFSGFVAPSMLGFMRASTGNLSGGMLILAACACLAGIAMLTGVKKDTT